jgi:hypothetical protein
MAAQGAGADAGAPQLVTRRALQELVRQIDPQERLTPEVEEVGVARVPPPVRHSQFPPAPNVFPCVRGSQRPLDRKLGLGAIEAGAAREDVADS